MEFLEYHDKAQATDGEPSWEIGFTVPVIGLAAEAGALFAEYKKRFRDGSGHAGFHSLVSQELGDVLRYTASIASKLGLSVKQIAEDNLRKTTQRWLPKTASQPAFFDAEHPAWEQLPRQFRVEVSTRLEAGRQLTRLTYKSRPFGDELTDCTNDPDGYRFHDILHLCFAVHLRWSPLARRNFGCKRRSRPEIDENEDGGRAIDTEEAVVALLFAYARKHSNLSHSASIGYDMLRTIRQLVEPFEVGVRTESEWEAAIMEGFDLLRLVREDGNGSLLGDLINRRIEFVPAECAAT